MRAFYTLPLLGFSLFELVAAGCPRGTVKGLTDDDCYLYESKADTWFSAEEACQVLGGHLTSVHDAFTNAFLPNQACTTSSSSGSLAYWIGGYWNDTASTWDWSDKTTADFTDWSADEPSLRSGSCIAMSAWSAQWSSLNCNAYAPYICKIPPTAPKTCPPPKPPPGCPNQPPIPCPTPEPVTCPACPPPVTCPDCPPPLQPVTPTCPSGWTYYDSTGKCYQAVCHTTAYDALVSCQNQGATMASAHNSDVHDWIYQFGISACSHSPDDWYGDDGTFRLGLFDLRLPPQAPKGNWQWADGTPYDYSNWRPSQPSSDDRCVSINNRDDAPGQWDDSDCSIQMHAAVCQRDTQ